ncbi:MAG TPA: sterol desaturase family protein [Candidatus Limnocylindrales bacterium]|nr:sterol desaturase family protein [Candidatus Limnocylindrales bacterium]
MAVRASDAMRPVPGWLSGALVLGTLAALYFLEGRRPLRRRTENRSGRTGRNLAVAALSAAAIRATEKPVTDCLSRLVVQRRWGLLQKLRLPLWLEAAVGIVLLDYTLYVWHVLTHKVPFLWRFHVAHHADLDLDASTALRFHFAEMVLSVPWRAGQVLLLGASPRTLSAWQTATLVAILFHHSNVELPASLERRLCRLVTTPRMHGIHHSIVEDETDSNWSTIFSFPDYLHGTIRLNVPQAAVRIGVPAYRDPGELGLGDLLALPFVEQRPTWTYADGSRPASRMALLPPAQLADASAEYADVRPGWRQLLS